MSRSPWSRLPVTAGLLSLAIAGAGLATSASPVLAASHHVQIADSAFGPSTLTVQVGDTVTWANADDRPHTVTAEGGAFDSGNIGEGGSFSFTFTEPGTYAYRCEYHPDMRATIVVEGAAPAPANPAPANPAPLAGGESAPQTGGGANTAQGAGSGTAGTGDQPDTALPAPWSLPGTSLVLFGLGLLAFAIGLVPRRRAASAATRMPGGWRR